MKLIEKTFRNSPKGRSKIPEKKGRYSLLDENGKVIYSGETNDLKERIKEHHYDKTKHFKFIKVRVMK